MSASNSAKPDKVPTKKPNPLKDLLKIKKPWAQYTSNEQVQIIEAVQAQYKYLIHKEDDFEGTIPIMQDRDAQIFEPVVRTFVSQIEVVNDINAGTCDKKGKAIVEVLFDTDTEPNLMKEFRTRVETILGDYIIGSDFSLNINYYRGEGHQLGALNG